MYTIQICSLLTTSSPLTHMMGVKGNESIISRRSLMTPNGIRLIPNISGNSIRHKMLREPAKEILLNELELRGKCNIDVLQFLDNGGTLMESSISDNLKTIATLKELFPIYKILGGSLRNQIIAGQLDVSDGFLICDENREIINRLSPKEYNLDSKPLLSSEAFIGSYQYTRGDAKRNSKNVDYFTEAEKMVEPEKSNLMIYNGQTIMTNAPFYQDFILKGVTELDIGSFFASIQQWLKSPTLGGSSRIGHGRMDYNWYTQFDLKEIDYYTNLYYTHIKMNKSAMVDFLFECFGDKKKEEKKPTKEKANKEKPVKEEPKKENDFFSAEL